MSEVVRISESTYKRLESLAKGFDTPGSVIDRLLDFYEKHHKTILPRAITPEKPVKPDADTNTRRLDPDNHDDLTHTKILEGYVGDDNIRSWNDLVYVVHKHALKHYGNFEALKKETHSNIFKGSLTERGYREYTDIGISIQGEDSNDSWEKALCLARKIKVSRIEVVFEWRNKKGAVHPGQKGRLFWEAYK